MNTMNPITTIYAMNVMNAIKARVILCTIIAMNVMNAEVAMNATVAMNLMNEMK